MKMRLEDRKDWESSSNDKLTVFECICDFCVFIYDLCCFCIVFWCHVQCIIIIITVIASKKITIIIIITITIKVLKEDHIWLVQTDFDNGTRWRSFTPAVNSVNIVFTCVSYAEARNSYRLDIRPSVRPSVCPSVRHTLAPYQNGWIYCHAFFTTR